jgi:hypothetical protein
MPLFNFVNDLTHVDVTLHLSVYDVSNEIANSRTKQIVNFKFWQNLKIVFLKLKIQIR